MVDVRSDLVRYGLLVVSAPLWVPFLKALWEELNDSLREEGGLFGSDLDEAELARLEREKGTFESPLVHEPWDEPNARPASGPRVGAAPPRPARPGFRDASVVRGPGGFRPGGR